jgi:hypothetical protein
LFKNWSPGINFVRLIEQILSKKKVEKFDTLRMSTSVFKIFFFWFFLSLFFILKFGCLYFRHFLRFFLLFRSQPYTISSFPDPSECFVLGVVHKWLHTVFDDCWDPLPPSSLLSKNLDTHPPTTVTSFMVGPFCKKTTPYPIEQKIVNPLSRKSRKNCSKVKKS